MDPASTLPPAATHNVAGSSSPRRTDVAAVLRYLAALLALTIIYAGAARTGLMLDAIAGFATLVWAPTGIALAALLLFGYRLWPAVFLGAFAVNLWTGAPLVAALGIALGNTLEAVAGTFALRRIPGFRPALDRLEDVASLIVVAAGVCTMISASIGVVSLALAGTITPSQIAVTWRAWWLGDLVGALVVAPLLLVWISARPPALVPRDIAEAAGVGVGAPGLHPYIFRGRPLGGGGAPRQNHSLFPAPVFSA